MPYIGNIVQDFSVSTAMLNTDSVTSIKVLDGTIVNADINASAAIAGTKISPDFGSQAIVTTGAITGQDFRTASSQTFFLTSGDDWNFRTITGSTKLTITNTGQVDFAGNVDCNAGLDVTGAITGTTSLTLGNTSLSSGYLINTTGDLYIRDTDGNIFIEAKTDQHAIRCIADGAVMLHHSGNPKLVTSSAGIDVTGAITATGDMTIDTNTLHVDSSNNRAGIGTTSPRSLLDLGTGTDASSVSNTAADYQLGLHAAQSTGGDIGRNIAFISQTVGTVTAAINSVDEGGSDQTGLVFLTGNNSSIDERVRIDQNGNVGIGTTSPGTLLDVEVGTNDKLEYGSNPRLYLKVPDGTNGLRIDASTTPLEIRNSDADGRSFSFGSGGASNFNMVLSGDYSLSSSGFDSSPTIFLNTTRHNGSTTVTSFQCSVQAVATSNANNTGYLGFGSSATPDDLVIKTDGVVGIGTTAPEGKGLDITVSRTNGYSGTTDTRNLANLICRNSSGAAGRFAALSFINGGATQAEGSINLVQTADYNGDLAFKMRSAVSTWSEVMRITSAGTLLSFSPDDTTPNIKWRSDDTNWFGSLNQSVEGATISTFLSTGGDWSANGTTYSATKAIANFETRAIVLHPQFNNGAGKVAFLQKAAGSTTTDGTVTEILKIDNDGIKFGTDTAAANALDDYEEGTFTASVASGGSSISYTLRRGSYTKIGDVVYFSIDFYMTGGTADGNNLQFGGLPFTSVNQATKAFGGAFLNYNNAAFGDLGDRVLFHVLSQDTKIQVYNSVTGNVLAGTSTGVNIFGSKEFVLTGIYQAS